MKLLDKLIRRVILSSIATSPVGIVIGNDLNSVETLLPFSVSEARISSGNSISLQPKLLLKFKGNDSWDINSHRSHRSHSSHRSHYSSSSSGSSGSSSSSSGSSSSSSNLGIKSATPSSNVLGSRTLKLGDVGSDVTQLVNLLLQKGYLVKVDETKTVFGVLTFDKVIEDAVKQFQIDKNQKADGVVGPSTLYLLKSN